MSKEEKEKQNKDIKEESKGIFIPKKVLSIALIIFVFVLGASVMYFGQSLLNSKKSTTTSGVSEKPTATIEQKTGSQAEVTDEEGILPETQNKTYQLPSGWKKYTSRYNTFSIGYPGDKKVIIEENRPAMPVCNLEVGDAQLKIYPKDYQYLEEPEFGGDLLLTIVSLNNEDNISLKDWINSYCRQDWVKKNLATLKSIEGEAVRSYSREMGKKMFVGYSLGGKLYFLYAYSNNQEKTPETIFAEMLNTFQTPTD